MARASVSCKKKKREGKLLVISDTAQIVAQHFEVRIQL
jgi:hypothetical protein